MRSSQKRLDERKGRIERRLAPKNWEDQPKPMLTAAGITYEVAERARGLAAGGIGAIHKMVSRLGLPAAINARLFLLQKHVPYWESDHVLNVAYNILCGGTCLEDLELLRNNEVYLDAVGAQRIPDPTTAGDFCRRFEPSDVEDLIDSYNTVRVRAWKQQGPRFFDRAVIDVDGTLAPTTGEKKEGMDISYKGTWGYHPLVVSFANTGEILSLVNRSGNRPSHEGASQRLDDAIKLCLKAGFKSVLLRGDTDFSQTEHLDRWDAAGVKFVFGLDAMPNLKKLANGLPEDVWKPLKRPQKYKVKTTPRRKRPNVKEQVIQQRGFRNIHLDSEHVAEIAYCPGMCDRPYRVVVVRKNLTIERGEDALIDDVRYFFYITNCRDYTPAKIVEHSNDRCNQENLIEQLKNGVRAMAMPVNSLVSNWAYMVMASLAWNLKAWFALLLPEGGRWKQKRSADKSRVLRMEFKTFLNALMLIPCQLVLKGRRVVYRLLAWNPWVEVLLRGFKIQTQPLR